MIQRENPAAAAAPANWVLRCPKVLRHQRRFPLLFLDCCSELGMVLILAVWSVTIVFLLHRFACISPSLLFFGIVGVIIEKPKTSHAFTLSSVQSKLVEVLRTDPSPFHLSRLRICVYCYCKEHLLRRFLAESIFCIAAFLLFGRGALHSSPGWSFHKNGSSDREQIALMLYIALHLLFNKGARVRIDKSTSTVANGRDMMSSETI